jgi:hypothetical protein
LWFVSNASNELALGPVGEQKPDVIVFTLGLLAAETGALYARIAPDKRAFLIATSATSERLVLRITHSFDEPRILAHPETLSRMATNPQSLAPDSAESGIG